MLASARLYLDFPGIEDDVWYNINAEGPDRCPRDSGMSGYPIHKEEEDHSEVVAVERQSGILWLHTSNDSSTT